MKPDTVHLRVARPKTRRKQPNGFKKCDTFSETFAMCAAWVPTRNAVRVDSSKRWEATCAACRTAASLSAAVSS